MIKLYKKKPIAVKAIQWTGDNYEKIKAFCGYKCAPKKAKAQVVIRTLEGNKITNINDYIVQGAKGEFYPVKKEIFDSTYDEVLS